MKRIIKVKPHKENFNFAKINLKDYSLHIVKVWVQNNLVSEEKGMSLINKAIELVETHLQCSKCNNIFPDEDFYSSKISSARRGKTSECKTCWKENRVLKGKK